MSKENWVIDWLSKKAHPKSIAGKGVSRKNYLEDLMAQFTKEELKKKEKGKKIKY